MSPGVFGGLIGFAAAALLARYFAPPGVKHKNEPSQEMHPPDSNWFNFVAMQYYAVILNRTYKVFVTDNYVYGIVVGGLVSAQMGKVGAEYQNPEFYVDKKRESQQLQVNLESNDFPQKGSVNFKIAKKDILRVDFKPKKFGMANIPYSGRIILVQKHGSKTELILLGRQDHNEVIEEITKN
jgi:hypothetical protein